MENATKEGDGLKAKLKEAEDVLGEAFEAQIRTCNWGYNHYRHMPQLALPRSDAATDWSVNEPIVHI